ncbi:MAG: hypothetical protein JWM73_492 [Solirubrobacterales bacterium]|nr:hypothetical protein [Solirubrobacterales bacterium]
MFASFPALATGTAMYLGAHSVAGMAQWLGVACALAGVVAFSVWAPATGPAYDEALGELTASPDERG